MEMCGAETPPAPGCKSPETCPKDMSHPLSTPPPCQTEYSSHTPDSETMRKSRACTDPTITARPGLTSPEIFRRYRSTTSSSSRDMQIHCSLQEPTVACITRATAARSGAPWDPTSLLYRFLTSIFTLSEMNWWQPPMPAEYGLCRSIPFWLTSLR